MPAEDVSSTQEPGTPDQPAFVSRQEVEGLWWLRPLCRRHVIAEIRVLVGEQVGPGYQAQFEDIDARGTIRMRLLDVPGGEGDPFENADIQVRYRDPVERVFACFRTRALAPLERQRRRAYLSLAAPPVIETLNSRRFYRVEAGPQDFFALVSTREAATSTPARVMDISGNGAKLRLLLEVTPPEALRVGADLIVRFEGRALHGVSVGHLSARAVVRRMEAERGYRVVAVELLGPPVSLQDAIMKYALERRHLSSSAPP